ncbi:hypothetical protein ACLO87_15695 [Paenalcaligenes sp. Me52]|uniref:hypothetical protein n=1 Tax=Paenalcaligenes sp. Me52 TaxID=3392038 RepID=UPI003D2DDCF5
MDSPKRNAPIAKSHESEAKPITEQHNIKPFQGTRNINELRALDAFLQAQGGPLSRKDLDRLCGAANSPEIVRRLREKGLSIKCDMQEQVNRFGEPVRAGYYSLTPYAMAKLRLWLHSQRKGMQ